MSARIKAFGGGLASVFQVEGKQNDRKIQLIQIEHIKRANIQARHSFEQGALEELAASIKEDGVLQPLLVRENDGCFELIAGERRLMAAKIAGLDAVPVIVLDVSLEKSAVIGLVENLQRSDLNPVDEAGGYKMLIDKFQMTHEQIAQSVGKSRATITNMLRLLSLDPFVLNELYIGMLEIGHAKVLLVLSTQEQIAAAKIVIARKLSVRATENLVRNFSALSQKSNSNIASKYKIKIPYWRDKLSNALRSKVQIKINNEGQGRAVIFFDSPGVLERIIDKINDNS